MLHQTQVRFKLECGRKSLRLYPKVNVDDIVKIVYGIDKEIDHVCGDKTDTVMESVKYITIRSYMS